MPAGMDPFSLLSSRETTAVDDIDALATSTRKSLALIECWRQEQSPADGTSWDVNVIPAAIVEQGRKYFDALTSSFATVEDCETLASDALTLCRIIQESQLSQREFDLILRVILLTTKTAKRRVDTGRDSFRSVRVALFQISREIVAATAQIGEVWDDDTDDLRNTEIIAAEEAPVDLPPAHTAIGRQLMQKSQSKDQLMAASRDVSQLIDQVGVLIDWWGMTAMHLGSLQSVAPQIRPNHTNPLREENVRQRWGRVKIALELYRSTMSGIPGYLANIETGAARMEELQEPVDGTQPSLDYQQNVDVLQASTSSRVEVAPTQVTFDSLSVASQAVNIVPTLTHEPAAQGSSHTVRNERTNKQSAKPQAPSSLQVANTSHNDSQALSTSIPSRCSRDAHTYGDSAATSGTLHFFSGAQNADVHSSTFNAVGHDQYITTNYFNQSAEEKEILATLRPADRAGYFVQPCTEGTRTSVIRDIDNWLDDSEVPNILWLTGSPGAGKSTIASTVVSNLTERRRLGSSFFFQYGHAVLSDPAIVWRTVAFDLARFHAAVASSLVSDLKQRRVDPERADIHSHFCYMVEEVFTMQDALKRNQDALQKNQDEREALHRASYGTRRESREDLEELSKALEEARKTLTEERRTLFKNRDEIKMLRPVVLLDALDECGSEKSQADQRTVFLNTIRNWARLPSTFKLIVTSRDERLPNFFRDGNICKRLSLLTGSRVNAEAVDDIRLFFEIRFAAISAQYPSLSRWPGESILEQLTQYAGGLFIWADTVVRFVGSGEDTPDALLKLILGGDLGEGGDTIYKLYWRVLEVSFKDSKPRVLEAFKAIVGSIVLAKAPLYRGELVHFLTKPVEESMIDLVLNKLSSVISFGDRDDALHISHLSFAEFLCDPVRCPESFYIDRIAHSQNLALICLRLMKESLKFNICEIGTSHLRNSDILDLATRVANSIPPRLSYSCCFWAEHLQDTPNGSEFVHRQLLEETNGFLHNRLLYWLEVMSFIKEMSGASSALFLASQWIRTSDAELSAFAADAKEFVDHFSTPILESTPHIYLSALPWSRKESRIAQHFLPQFPHVLSLPSPTEDDLTPSLGDRNLGCSSAVLSDGRRVMSRSDDGAIGIWDMQTGQIISGPWNGRRCSITLIAFSRDGKRAVSASDDNTLCIWDIEMGQIVAGPLKGHADHICSVAFSPDERRIVSGSYDKMMYIWNVETGRIALGPFGSHGGVVRFVGFSSDGKHIFSGSSDNSLWIWDIETGKMISGPFKGHTDHVGSIAFSPDGRTVASGAYDGTIRIWDTETCQMISGPLEGHQGVVRFVAFSADGLRVFSGSADNTIRVWHAGTSGEFDRCGLDPNDGWMKTANRNGLLFWVPPIFRGSICGTNTMRIIGGSMTRVDMSNFVHGSSWVQCQQSKPFAKDGKSCSPVIHHPIYLPVSDTPFHCESATTSRGCRGCCILQ